MGTGLVEGRVKTATWELPEKPPGRFDPQGFSGYGAGQGRGLELLHQIKITTGSRKASPMDHGGRPELARALDLREKQV
jgi:hypothetical protein